MIIPSTEVSASLTCQQLVEAITDYLEASIAPECRDACDKHLESCENCREYLDQIRQTILAIGRVVGETVPVDARKALIHRFRELRAG